MSYLGLVKPICNSLLKNISAPKILEIGTDKGQTLLPMIQNLITRYERFTYVGVDILVRDDLVAQIHQFHNANVLGWDPPGKRDILLEQENSLSWLAKVQLPEDFKFDLVLLDGDHNYATVSKELQLLQRVIRPETFIVCDDFNGRWAEKDMFYIEKEEYRDNDLASPSLKSEKQGVGSAVRDFIGKNNNWDYIEFPPFEPAILYRSDIWKKPGMAATDQRGHMKDLIFLIDRFQPKGEEPETHME